MPEVSGNKLSISPKKGAENQFELDANGFKDIEVTLDNSINSNGIKMRSNYGWTYRVSNATDEQTLVNFAVDSKCGEMTPSGKASYNVGSEIKIKFTESELFEFIDWEIVSEDGLNLYADVTGSSYDKQSRISEAVITVLEGNGNLTIKPVCAPRPVVESFAPAWIAAGTNFDSSIVLTFAAEVSKESFVYSDEEFAFFGEAATAVRANPNDENSDIVAVDVAGKRYFKNLTITDEENENVAIHYRKSELSADGKKLTVYFDGSRLFDFGGKASKDIYVTVSPEIYSDFTKADETTEKIRLSNKGKSQDFNFRVRNASEAKAKVTFSAYDGSTSMGTMNYNGEQEYSLGQKVSVIFTPAVGYEFLRWSVTGDTEGSLLFDDDKSKTTLSFTVSGSAHGIEIKPYCEKLNTSKILFETSSGTISPSGSQYIRRNETVDLICKVSEKNCFAGWKVVNTVSKEVLSREKYEKYFEFGDIKSPETTLKVRFDNKNLAVVADTYIRPEVCDHDPVNQISGTERDQSIRIFVSLGIAEDSLYFTDEETALFKAQGLKLLDAGNEINHKYYGYYTEGDDNSYVFKNVKIVNRGNISENLLQYYGAPYLQNKDGTIIVIPVRPDNLPPAYKEILVTLGTDYGYYADDGKTIIGLYNNNLIFSYKTNDRTDASEPVFNTVSLSGTKSSGTKTELSSFSSAPSIPDSGTFDFDEYNNYYLKPEADGTIKIDVDIKVSDSGMNLNSLSLCMEKLRDNEYKEPSVHPLYVHKLPVEIASTEGTFNVVDFKISDYLKNDGAMEGLYKIYFKATDLAGHSVDTASSQFYYILFDRYAPKQISDQNYKYYVKNGFVKVTGLSKAKDPDTAHTWIKFNEKTPVEITEDDFSVPCSEFTKAQDVKIEIITEDKYGNTRIIDSQYNSNFSLRACAENRMYMYDDGLFSHSGTEAEKEHILGIVYASDYSETKQKLSIAYKNFLRATPADIMAGNYPDPALAGILEGCNYRIPTFDEWIGGNPYPGQRWEHKLSYYDRLFASIGCSYDEMKSLHYGEYNAPYNFNNFFYKNDSGDGYGLHHPDYHVTSMWTQKDLDENITFAVLYLVDYQDNAN